MANGNWFVVFAFIKCCYIHSATLDRVVCGLLADEVIASSKEQTPFIDDDDASDAHASQTVQMLRAIKHKSFATVCCSFMWC